MKMQQKHPFDGHNYQLALLFLLDGHRWSCRSTDKKLHKLIFSNKWKKNNDRHFCALFQI